MTPLELAVRRNKGKRLLPPFLDSISSLERFSSERPTISFCSLEQTDDDQSFIITALAPNAQCDTHLLRWTNPRLAETFFRSLAMINTSMKCHIIVKDSRYFGTMLLEGNAGIFHAVDLARCDGDTASFIIGDRESCFYVDIVDDFDFVGIEAKFWGKIVNDIADSGIDLPEDH